MDDHHAQLWRARATAVRHSPLKPLAAQLGYHKDPLNRARWKRPGSVLSITGSKFFDHCCGQGGGGAIDLVMHAQGCCFTQAVRWLEGHPGPLPDGPAASRHSATNLRLPSRDDRNWPPVCDYLVQARGLCPQLLGRCLTSSILYADQRSNAVFLWPQQQRYCDWRRDRRHRATPPRRHLQVKWLRNGGQLRLRQMRQRSNCVRWCRIHHRQGGQ